jgi:hypothetical protein
MPIRNVLPTASLVTAMPTGAQQQARTVRSMRPTRAMAAIAALALTIITGAGITGITGIAGNGAETLRSSRHATIAARALAGTPEAPAATPPRRQAARPPGPPHTALRRLVHERRTSPSQPLAPPVHA